MLYKFTNTVDGEEDPVFVSADDEKGAFAVFKEAFGAMPRHMISVKEIDKLPDDTELLN